MKVHKCPVGGRNLVMTWACLALMHTSFKSTIKPSVKLHTMK
jgi:hypothetical protein